MATRFQFTCEPVADPAAAVLAPDARFTVLTSRLLRIEYGHFEDRPSQVFWHRKQPVPPYGVIREKDRLEIETEHLRLRYVPHARGLTRKSLSIELKALGKTWRYGERDPHNLSGTARTLDGAAGPIRLDPGLVSRSGWSVVDDSRALVFDESSWLRPRAGSGIDLYFFGYGHDYVQCLKDYRKLAGPAPLIPRFILGNWWSRYWEYSQAELIKLMSEFERQSVPLSVCIVDMDWHVTRTGNEATGWTGYTWNRDLFPDPEAFIDWLHQHGLKTALNLHPAEGVYPHESMYEEMARFMGVDPAAREPIAFDIADPKFAEGYFDILHHPLEAQGVDFWWLDWQQGTGTKLAYLDPLWWLNHLHFHDLGRDGVKRPFIFSRWGGLGNHRYPIGFSGDTPVTWEALAFQPHFTATAANAGYGWWSHDIGGHMQGIEDAELFTRWVQFGVFSPIFRLHSTKNAYHDRRPWGYDAETFHITRDAMQLRHALIPYLYTMARRDHVESIPLIVPLYHLYPEQDDAYQCPNQYAFGSELIAAPFTSPRDPDTRLSRQGVWLPDGDWFDFFNAEYFAGDRWHSVYGVLEDVPVFARAGAIVPLGPRVGWGGIDAPAELYVHIFPGADNRFELYEDDDATTAYPRGQYALTPFTQEWRGDQLLFTVDPIIGERACVPGRRGYTLVFKGVRRPDDIEVIAGGAPQQPALSYDAAMEKLTLHGIILEPTHRLSVKLSMRSGRLMSKRDRTLENCRRMLRTFRLETDAKGQIDAHLPELMSEPGLLSRYAMGLRAAHAGALMQALQRR